ncbi:hypothetical protein D3C83_126430 [compost metagenome]
MQGVPLQDQIQRASRKAAFNDSVGDADGNLEVCILRVEMRWIMIVVVHRDDDPKET